MKHPSDELFVETMNRVINDTNPLGRIMLMGSLCRGFGRLLVAPKEPIEQLCNKIEQEAKTTYTTAKYALPTTIALKHVAFLRVFLKHRDSMAAELREMGFKSL
jgi:hypothetical protein